jgi:hypothetical protein
MGFAGSMAFFTVVQLSRRNENQPLFPPGAVIPGGTSPDPQGHTDAFLGKLSPRSNPSGGLAFIL